MSESLVAEKNRRARWFLIGLVAIVVAAVGGWFALRAHRRKQAWHRVAQAASDVDRCLIGEPLAAGEKYEHRLTLIAANNRPPEPTDPWPQRCLPKLDALDGALEADGVELSTPDHLQFSSAIYRAHEAVKSAVTDLGALRQYNLQAELADLHLPAVASDGRPPPAPASPIDVLWPIGDRYDRHMRDGHVEIWNDSRACAITVGSGQLTCVAISNDLPRPPDDLLPQLDPTSGPKLRLAGADARRNAYRLADGAAGVARAKLGPPFAGASLGDAFAVLTVGSPIVLVRSHGSSIDETKLTIPPDSYPYVAGPYAVWHADGHLFLQRIVSADGSIGPVIDAGASDGGEDGRFCTTHAGLAFSDAAVLGVVHDDRWQAITGAPRMTSNVTMTCTGEEITFAWIDEVVHAVTCNATECRAEQRTDHRTKEIDDFGWRNGRVVPLGDKWLLVHHDRDGLWMRLAPFAQLDGAHETLLSTEAFDVADIFANSTSAIVIARYASGLAAIRIGANGKFYAVGSARSLAP